MCTALVNIHIKGPPLVHAIRTALDRSKSHVVVVDESLAKSVARPEILGELSAKVGGAGWATFENGAATFPVSLDSDNRKVSTATFWEISVPAARDSVLWPRSGDCSRCGAEPRPSPRPYRH